MAYLAGCSLNTTKNLAEFSTVTVGEQTFKVEVAQDSFSRQQGLMFRESLDLNAGMIFVFDEPGQHPFWMKNTLIPLDIIWISAENIITDITTMQPCALDPCPSYQPNELSLYVLEVGAGVFEGKIGDSVVFKP